MKRGWVRALAVAGGVLAASLLALFLYIDVIATGAVERSSAFALGVETHVGSARIKLLSGSFGLSGLEVANPPGFQEPRFLALRDAQLDLDLATLRQPTVTAPLLSIRGVEVDLDRQQGRTNYAMILDNLARFESEGKDEVPPGSGEGTSKRFVLQDLVIRDIEAHVRVAEVAGLGKIDVIVPEVRIRNLGGGGRPLTIAQVSSIVVKAVLASIAKQAVGLPGGVASLLSGGLGRLSGVSIELPEGGTVRDASTGALRAGADAAGSARDAGRSAAEGAGKTLKSLGGRLRGDD